MTVQYTPDILRHWKDEKGRVVKDYKVADAIVLFSTSKALTLAGKILTTKN